MPTISFTTAQTHALQVSIEQAGLTLPKALRHAFVRTCQARLASIQNVGPGAAQLQRSFHQAIDAVAVTITETRRQADQLVDLESKTHAPAC